jgi:hypothetical protein
MYHPNDWSMRFNRQSQCPDLVRGGRHQQPAKSSTKLSMSKFYKQE